MRQHQDLENQCLSSLKGSVHTGIWGRVSTMLFMEKVRYGNKSIEDTTRERRYYEWVAQNTEFNDNDIPQEATMYDNHYSFDVEIDYGKTRDDLYSRRFDEYKKVFDNEMKQLGYEYDLGIGKKGYALDDVWEKCEKFHGDTVYQWHDEGFKEEERWESGIEKTDYELPFVDIKTFEIKRYSFEGGRIFVCITKQLDDALPLGRANNSRFVGMIRKEMDDDGNVQRKMFSQKELEFEFTLTRNHVVKMVLFGRNHSSYAITELVTTYVLWKPLRDFTRPLGPPNGLKGLLHILNATVIPMKAS
ncbi:hypothetical protein Tco_0911513 [Tanacetum coccineum]|uniref:Uncharacterized protein n=1 Tax=Tanacetum coccineum TaxID=301880 RepID=A0ABQ5CWZ8_9ASTR